MSDRGQWLPKILGYVLWAVSALVGVGALFAAISIVETVIPRLFTGCDPMQTVECSGQARALMMMGYGALGIGWLIWYIVIAERYTHAKSPELVARRFATTTAAQLAIILVWLIVTKLILA